MPYKIQRNKGLEVDEYPGARANIVPTDADAGTLGEAVFEGNYRAFRLALSGYEEWLRKRVGQWLQRFPEVEARVGRGLSIGDVVEEVYLMAFETYTQRSTAVPLHDWLDGLIDESVKVLMKHRGRESETASFARTVRDSRELD
jgi:hypothetical protein